jgi:predicted O-linked N-acetylglucosamine transferase (SPINDLY family)
MTESVIQKTPGKSMKKLPLGHAADVPQAVLSIEQLFNLADALQRNAQDVQCLELYANWLQATREPNRYLVHFNHACLLQKLGKKAEADQSYLACLSIKPEFAHALVNRGLLLESMGQSAEALTCWGQVVASRYNNASATEALVVTALNHIGRLQEILKEYGQSQLALEESLRINPDQPGVLQHWVHIRQKTCQWPIYKSLPNISKHHQLMCTSPLAELALHDDPVHQLLIAKSFVARTYEFQKETLSQGERKKHDRMRLGYVSGDLCVHAVGLLIADVFEQHDQAQFEIFIYDFSPEDNSVHRQRIRQAVPHWRDIRHLSDRQAAELMQVDEVDVLIDLHGLSSGARPGIFALRPAPLQGQYLGFMGTTGMPWLDFVVSDRYALTAQAADYFVETPLYVDGTFIPLTGSRDKEDGYGVIGESAVTREDLGMKDSHFVMAGFGNLYKMNEALFDTWLRLLKEIPEAVLCLVDDNDLATKNLKQYALRQGLGEEKIKFTPRVSPAQFRQQLKLVDVFLDTYPYNCGSTSNDVIAAGTPMVTLSGRTMVSRMGGSILQALGMSEWIATDAAQYQAIVMKLAQRKRVESLRYNKDAEIKVCLQRMVRSLELGLRELHQRQQVQ